MRRKRHFLLILWLAGTLLALAGCEETREAKRGPEEFDGFLRSVFVEEVQSDAVTLHFTLRHPESFGIEGQDPTFGEYSVEAWEEGREREASYLEKMREFSYSDLSREQRIAYDVLEGYLELDLSEKNKALYAEALGPTTGLQAELPVLLAEYRFDGKEDVEDYLALLGDLPRYFGQIARFEEEKSEAGLFMSDRSADAILSQCENFMEREEDNPLIEAFDERVGELSFLTEEEREAYREENRSLVLGSVLPAYGALADGIRSLKGTGTNEGGLCHFPEGKEYYEYLVEATTGSSKSMRQIRKALSDGIQDSFDRMAEAAGGDGAVLERAEEAALPEGSPSEILDRLREAMGEDYPAMEDVECEIKRVPESLEEDLSPAFYLVPPLDGYGENCIYINGDPRYGQGSIFATLAHEGYPGHLYQNAYYGQQAHPPIRALLSFGGYAEGWGTYAEMESYGWMGLEEEVAAILRNSQVATLCLYAQADVGINYYGWDLDDTEEYLEDYGITGEGVAEEVFDTMVEEPASYVKYALGYLEIWELREEAEEELGERFSLREWHEFFLGMGPAQFGVIEDYMGEWVAERKRAR